MRYFKFLILLICVFLILFTIASKKNNLKYEKNQFNSVSFFQDSIPVKIKNIQINKNDLEKNNPLIFEKIRKLIDLDSSSKFNYELDLLFDTLLLQNKKKDYFEINITKRKIQISSCSYDGLKFAFLEFVERFNKNELYVGKIVDYPKINNRFLHLCILPNTTKSKILSYIDLAFKNRFNKIIFMFGDRLALESMKSFSISKSMSKSDFIDVVNYAISLGIKIIPEVNCLTHQKIFIKDKSLLYNDVTYDPRKKEVYDLIFAIFDELIEITKCEYLHIGHDELQPSPRKSNDYLPPSMFLFDVVKLDNYLKNKKIKTMMWSDVLLDHKQFNNKGAGITGNAEYQLLLDSIPKNIIICDWKYFEEENFNPAKFILNKGFITFGATWYNRMSINMFSEFISKNVEYEKTGMIATTYEAALSKHKKEKGIDVKVEDIINYSGKVFWNGK